MQYQYQATLTGYFQAEDWSAIRAEGEGGFFGLDVPQKSRSQSTNPLQIFAVE